MIVRTGGGRGRGPRQEPADPRVVATRLRGRYGRPLHHNKRDPLGELVFILLSTQTREAKYRGTFAALWTRYRSWERVLAAPSIDLVRLIRFGGLAVRKVDLLKQLLWEVKRREGRVSLRRLRQVPTTEAEAYLLSLPGVGTKTARCVLMYSLGRPVLPVDTHVWRISTRLGWLRGGKHPDDWRSRKLEEAIPARLRHSLHVTLVAHGRAVCRARPACDMCLLADLCPRTGVLA